MIEALESSGCTNDICVCVWILLAEGVYIRKKARSVYYTSLQHRLACGGCRRVYLRPLPGSPHARAVQLYMLYILFSLSAGAARMALLLCIYVYISGIYI